MQIILNCFAEARADESQEMLSERSRDNHETNQNAEAIELFTEECDMVR